MCPDRLPRPCPSVYEKINCFNDQTDPGKNEN